VDTVRPYNPRNGQGNGFLFSDYRPEALLQALRNARDAFGNKKIWTRLQKNGMKADFSWDRSAAEYVKLYKRLSPLRAARKSGPTRVGPSSRNRTAGAASKKQR
jgi:glycogen synthase